MVGGREEEKRVLMAVSPYPKTVIADMEGMYFQRGRPEWKDTMFLGRRRIHRMYCGLIMPKGNTDWGKLKVFDRGALHG